MLIFSDYTTKNAMSYKGVGHVIFSLHLSASNMPERLEIDKIPLLIQQVPAIHAYKTFSLL